MSTRTVEASSARHPNEAGFQSGKRLQPVLTGRSDTMKAGHISVCLAICRIAVGTAMTWLCPVGEAGILTVCVSENPTPTLTYPDRDAPAQQRLRRAVERQGDTVNFVAAPWLRCRVGLKSGNYDAAMPMIASAENLADFAFPFNKGALDASRSVGSLTIGVLRRVGRGIEWDGKAFNGLETPVMVLPGQTLARNKLKSLGVSEDTGSPRTISLLRKLALGRGDIAVMPTGVAAEALNANEFRGVLELLPQPLTSDIAFVSFNRQFQRDHPDYTEAVWFEIGRQNASGSVDGKRECVESGVAQPRRRAFANGGSRNLRVTFRVRQGAGSSAEPGCRAASQGLAISMVTGLVLSD